MKQNTATQKRFRLYTENLVWITWSEKVESLWHYLQLVKIQRKQKKPENHQKKPKRSSKVSKGFKNEANDRRLVPGSTIPLKQAKHTQNAASLWTGKYILPATLTRLRSGRYPDLQIHRRLRIIKMPEADDAWRQNRTLCHPWWKFEAVQCMRMPCRWGDGRHGLGWRKSRIHVPLWEKSSRELSQVLLALGLWNLNTVEGLSVTTGGMICFWSETWTFGRWQRKCASGSQRFCVLTGK